MKILLTGSNGQLGKEILRQTNDYSDLNIIATDSKNLDITDNTSVNKIIFETKPDIIINCPAHTNVDGCETDENNAYKINAVGARNLAVAANEINAKIVQISTDYVFDGLDNSIKREFDKINPQSVYGKSKELGERLVREANNKNFILRTAWLYGDGSNFVKTMLKIAGQQSTLRVVNDQFGTPTSTVDLASCVLELIKTNHYGTYHATCEGSCSWFDFANKIFEIKGLKINVEPSTTAELNRPAPRPKYSVLDNFMLNLIGMNSFRNWEESLEEYLNNI